MDDPYEVPQYSAPEDEVWYHFLHGNVPGHQIDFMYRPEVPQGALTRQHFSHLARLIKYIEPVTEDSFAFAIGNLSRDDTQHEPGRGGMSLIFGLRIKGATDHAGRRDPPFAHGVAAIDRAFDTMAIFSAARAFGKHVLSGAASAAWYKRYVEAKTNQSGDVLEVLADYVSAFRDMPVIDSSDFDLAWKAGERAPPRRVVIVHNDDSPFSDIAAGAARIAAVLYRSDIRWTSITNGREADLSSGVSVRLIAESYLTPSDEALSPWHLRDLPDDEAALAKGLFGAEPARASGAERRLGWRDRATRERGSMVGPPVRDPPSWDDADGPKRSSWEGAPPPRATRPIVSSFNIVAHEPKARGTPVNAPVDAQPSPPERDTPVGDKRSSDHRISMEEAATAIYERPDSVRPPPDLDVDVSEAAPPKVPVNGAAGIPSKTRSIVAASKSEDDGVATLIAAPPPPKPIRPRETVVMERPDLPELRAALPFKKKTADVLPLPPPEPPKSQRGALLITAALVIAGGIALLLFLNASSSPTPTPAPVPTAPVSVSAAAPSGTADSTPSSSATAAPPPAASNAPAPSASAPAPAAQPAKLPKKPQGPGPKKGPGGGVFRDPNLD